MADTNDNAVTTNNFLWFNQEYFAQQKIDQMDALGITYTDQGNAVATVAAVIKGWTGTNGDKVEAWNNIDGQTQLIAGGDGDRGYLFTNWWASNDFMVNPGGHQEGDYYPASGIDINQLNVSPNALFDIPYYLCAMKVWGQQTTGEDGQPLVPTNLDTAGTLTYLWDNGHRTAWQHYQGGDVLRAYLNDENGTHTDPRLDCSASFSTEKYIAFKVQQTGQTWNEVVQDMIDRGVNALEDCYNNGWQQQAETGEFAVDPAKQYSSTEINFNPGDQWKVQDPDAPVDDPYDAIQTVVDLGNKADTAHYVNGVWVGDNNVNTEFSAVYTQGEQTLTPETIIAGGSGTALNTLSVELGKSWDGFNGQGTAGSSDNVTSVGRVQIVRSAESQPDMPLYFDASGISSQAVQFDIQGAGYGATNLTNLSDAVATVNYSDFQVRPGLKEVTADLGWADGSAPENLTIGVNDLIENGYLKVTGIEDVKNLTVNARGGVNNGVDVTAATGAQTINVTGRTEVDVKVGGTGNTLKTLDATHATGDVNFHIVPGEKVGQTVIGGNGDDTVTIESSTDTTKETQVRVNNWTKVDNLALNGAQDISVNGDGMPQSLTDIWFNGDGTYAMTNASGNLTAHHGAIGQTVSTSTGSINGTNLTGITWTTAETGAVANFSSNASKTATINVTDNGTVADGSSFTFANAGTVTISRLGESDFTKGIDLIANNATQLIVQNTSDLVLNGTTNKSDLGKVESLTATLNEVTAGEGDFDISDAALSALTYGSIAAQGQNVKVGAIGGYDATAANCTGDDFTLAITGANEVTLGQLGAAQNMTVNVTDATENVTLDSMGTTGTGSVTLTVATEGDVAVAAGSSISSGTVSVNMSRVEGNVGDNTNALTLSAAGSQGISYTGANGDGFAGTGKDTVQITGVGDGSASNVSLGAGKDSLTIDAGAMQANTSATISVNCGANDGVQDTITVNNQTNSGADLVVDIRGFEYGTDKLGGFTAADISGWGASIPANLASYFPEATIPTNGTSVAVGSESGWLVGDTLYIAGTVGAASNDYTTLVIIHGVPEIEPTGGYVIA